MQCSGVGREVGSVQEHSHEPLRLLAASLTGAAHGASRPGDPRICREISFLPCGAGCGELPHARPLASVGS
jgi:hypothetical protein